LTTSLNGLEVNYKLEREIAAEMAVDGFVAPVLNLNAANVAQAGGGAGGNNNQRGLTCWIILHLQTNIICYVTPYNEQLVIYHT
jgi:hypothetical protein